VKALPVVGTSSRYDTAHLTAARGAIQADRHGCVLRVTDGRFYQPNLDADLATLLHGLGIAHKDAHLLVDLETIALAAEPAVVHVVPTLLSGLASLAAWRSVSVAATAFPVDLSGFGRGFFAVRRSCWIVWYNIFKSAVGRKPLFGDYCVDSHDRADPDVDPRFMKASTNIRYVTGNEWLILKGHPWRDHPGAPMVDLCTQLVADPRYSGAAFSAGDAFIDACAKGGPAGNATSWRKVAVSHHITHAVRQLASLGAPSAVF